MGTGYEEYAFVADLYDHVAVYRDRPDIGFFVEAAVSAGAPVLEVGCGTGRVLMVDSIDWYYELRGRVAQG